MTAHHSHAAAAGWEYARPVPAPAPLILRNPAFPPGPERLRPDARLVQAYGRRAALRSGMMPWRRFGALTVFAALPGRPGPADRAALPRRYGRIAVVPIGPAGFDRALASVYGTRLASAAETSVPAGESCRTVRPTRMRRFAAGAALVLTALALLAPGALIAGLLAVSLISLAAWMALRVAAAVTMLATLRSGRWPVFATARHDPDPHILPAITLLIPLYREAGIAARLLDRLGRLDYPAGKLDICLIVEADDALTIQALGQTPLPDHARVLKVPFGRVRTKPRALNYALAYARGDIIGVYDAEDAPAPDQLRRVVRAFATHGPEVACLQGVLDFYNARRNWLTRCFAIDYATWFRLILPGMRRLGLVLPLGGTTLFFRRAALETLEGWDAHNVTEDADLGLRLARRGYRTELVATVTGEEALDRVWPWIRQRSRWMKGYWLTWAVHMRDPAALWGDLGGWRFAGVQIVFLGTILQFLLAPFLWSFWALAFGGTAPASAYLSPGALVMIGGIFVLSELTVMLTGLLAVSRPSHRWLMPWVPTMLAYFPLGAVALYKALAEVATRPFYWDKTHHGGAGG